MIEPMFLLPLMMIGYSIGNSLGKPKINMEALADVSNILNAQYRAGLSKNYLSIEEQIQLETDEEMAKLNADLYDPTWRTK